MTQLEQWADELTPTELSYSSVRLALLAAMQKVKDECYRTLADSVFESNITEEHLDAVQNIGTQHASRTDIHTGEDGPSEDNPNGTEDPG